MKSGSTFITKLTSNGNLAFVIVVLASYLSAATVVIYRWRTVRIVDLSLLVVLAIAYLVFGTYGFTVCRRRGTLTATLVYFAIQLSLAAVLIWIRGSAGELSLILFPLAGHSALVLPPRWMVSVCALVYGNLMLPLIIRSQWIEALTVALAYGTGIVVVVVFTRIAASERAARAELAEANQQLREQASQIQDLAITEERNRLAREIHDSIGHYLTVVNVQIGAAQTMIDRDQQRALYHLSQAQTLTQEGLTEVRRSVATLRSSPMQSHPLPTALEKMTEQWNTAKTQARFDIVGNPLEISPQAYTTLYRATQEALTNVGKHANASRVVVTLDYS